MDGVALATHPQRLLHQLTPERWAVTFGRISQQRTVPAGLDVCASQL